MYLQRRTRNHAAAGLATNRGIYPRLYVDHVGTSCRIVAARASAIGSAKPRSKLLPETQWMLWFSDAHWGPGPRVDSARDYSSPQGTGRRSSEAPTTIFEIEPRCEAVREQPIKNSDRLTEQRIRVALPFQEWSDRTVRCTTKPVREPAAEWSRKANAPEGARASR